MNLKLVSSRLALIMATSVAAILGSSIKVQAAEIRPLNLMEPYSIYTESYDTTDTKAQEAAYLTAISEEYLNRAFADMEEFSFVRSMPDNESDWVGKLYPKNLVTVVEIQGKWTKIISGNVQGFVLTEDLAIGKDAYDRMDELRQQYGVVNISELNLRSGPGTNYEILGQVNFNQEIAIHDAHSFGSWMLVEVNQEEYYVYGKYIDLKDIYTFAETKAEEIARLEQEAKEKAGENLVEYAKQYLGNPYVWGGTSLSSGADCSGFVQSIYKNFGIYLPRTSSAQRSAGRSVSYSDAEPGDIICYSGHVGIYIGDGKIINALNKKKGIVISNANMQKILSVRRVL